MGLNPKQCAMIGIVALAVTSWSASEARAALLFGVDFNQNSSGTISPTEGGAGDANSNDSTVFGAMNFAYSGQAGPTSSTFAGYSVSLAAGNTLDGNGNLSSTGGLIGRDRGAPVDAELSSNSNTGFTFGELYRDFVTANNLYLEVSGLTPNTQYAVTFYAYDNNGNRTQTFTSGLTGTGGTVATIHYNASGVATTFTSATPDNIYADGGTVTSDADGKLFFTETGAGGTFGAGTSSSVAVFDGFQISSVPEPASLGMLAVATMLPLIRRRRVVMG